MRYVLVHSPVVGPSTWRWVAEALSEVGEEAIVPDLVAAALTGNPARFTEAAASAARSAEPVVLVGHSGAGALLPAIAAQLDPSPQLVVFVDAGLPPCQGILTVGGAFLETMEEMAVDGILTKWSQWWGEGVMEAIIRDKERRLQVEAELPEVPVDFFRAPIRLPPQWCGAAVAYLLLSDGYRFDADRAATHGWPVRRRPGDHLDIVNEERDIARILVDFGGHS